MHVSNADLQEQVELLRDRVELLERLKQLEVEVDLSDDTRQVVEEHFDNLHAISRFEDENELGVFDNGQRRIVQDHVDNLQAIRELE